MNILREEEGQKSYEDTIPLGPTIRTVILFSLVLCERFNFDRETSLERTLQTMPPAKSQAI